jgi:hypothetical protein
MSTGTTAFEFKAALVVELQARPGLGGVQIEYAFPEGELHTEAIWLGDPQAILTALPAQCPDTQVVDESYTQPLVIQVLLPDGDDGGQYAADLRAGQLLAELQQLLAESPQIIDVIHQAEITGWTNKALRNNTGGLGARFDVVITVEASLSP